MKKLSLVCFGCYDGCSIRPVTFNAAAEEGVTDTEIHIGQWGPQTGPAAPWGRWHGAPMPISR
jgi:hypothetical protein